MIAYDVLLEVTALLLHCCTPSSGHNDALLLYRYGTTVHSVP